MPVVLKGSRLDTGGRYSARSTIYIWETSVPHSLVVHLSYHFTNGDVRNLRLSSDHCPMSWPKYYYSSHLINLVHTWQWYEPLVDNYRSERKTPKSSVGAELARSLARLLRKSLKRILPPS